MLFIYLRLILILPPILLGCNYLGELKISKDSTTQSGNTSNSSMNFGGITSTDLKTDSDVFDATASSIIWLKTIAGLTPGSTYKFLVRAKDSYEVIVTMNAAPESSPSFTVNPIVRVNGVKFGDSVRDRP
jgi:hypothetical protein